LRRSLLLACASLAAVLAVVSGAVGTTASRSAVIVMLKRPATAPVVSSVVGKAGGMPIIRRFHTIDGFAARATKAEVRALRNDPRVQGVYPDAIVRLEESDAKTSFGVSQARIEIPGLTGNADGDPTTYSKNDMVVAVLDSGIDTTHQDFANGKLLAFKDFVNGQTAPYDDNSHGTLVASILTGEGNGHFQGVAPGAALVSVKVTAADGVANLDNEIAGLDWVIANKALYNIRVVNMSLGTPGCWGAAEPVEQAVARAVAAGIVVVAAAGNGGPGTCTVKLPGAAPDAIAVANMADTGASGFYLSPDSSRGPTADGRIKPDISAPGVNIGGAVFGTGNGYDFASGTSMSSPFVAGVVLLMLQENPSLTPAQVKSILMSTAVDWGRGGDATVPGSTGPDIDYGAGRLDAYAALKAAGAPLNSPPPSPPHVTLEGTIDTAGGSWQKQLVVSGSAPLAATMIIPNADPSTKNLDLALLDSSGNTLATSTTTSREERISYGLPAGVYVLKATSVQGTGDFFIDVSGATVAKPPALTLPGDMTVNATSPSGAAVTYTVTANDAAGNSLTPTCSPASGSTFPVGATPVSCSATDGNNLQSTGSFSVTVKPYQAPPTLTLPANMTVNATSSSGAAVTYTATAKDGSGNALTPSCSPASGSAFPIGTTTVSCSATDGNGVKTTGSFTVTVRSTSTRPPTLTLPPTSSVDATSPAGAVVTYTVSAKDSAGQSLTPTCLPASGSTFPIGATYVSCSARDAAGLTTSGRFLVNVRSAFRQLLNLDALIRSYGTKSSERYLIHDVDLAAWNVYWGYKTNACSLLRDFVGLLSNSYYVQRDYSSTQRDALRANAARIMAVIPC